MRHLFIVLCAGSMLSACASVDPQALQKARVECNRTYPALQTKINEYYHCVQEQVPFGAFANKSNRKKADADLLPVAISPNFETEVDFINKAPAEDAPWLMTELSVRALADGDIKLAYELLVRTADKVKTIYGDSDQAKRARGSFNQEAEKLFIGESHERAMIFHYLGIADLMRGDYQNARASFAAALLQDSRAAKEDYKKDFSSALWLQGWAAHCVGNDRARVSFAQAQNLTNTPPPHARDDLLVVVEVGRGPFKLAQGEHGEKLIYGALTPSRMEQTFQPAAYDLYLVNDLYFQATTRGDRAFDDYLKDKAQTKKSVATVSKATFLAGLMLLDAATRSDNTAAQATGAIVGLSLMAVAGIGTAVAAAITPHADVRTIRALPDSIYVGSFNTNKGNREKLDDLLATVRTGQEQGRLSAVYADRGKCSILWVKDKSYG